MRRVRIERSKKRSRSPERGSVETRTRTRHRIGFLVAGLTNWPDLQADDPKEEP